MSTAGGRESLVLAAAPPAVLGPVARILGSPGRFCLATLAITVTGLALDRSADLGLQTLLGLCTWAFLILLLGPATPLERAQTSVVVVVATAAEVLGSVVWGVYEYRLGNLPLFVPPGHGLVYLTGLRLSQTVWVRQHARLFVRVVIGAVLGWALLGLVVLERLDVAGAVGAVVLTGFLVWGRAPAVYSGVFVAVAFLELYGTWVGTWTWATHIPGIGVPDGNPPSGAASGYVLFDICALALAPWLLSAARRLRSSCSPIRSGRRGVDRAVDGDEADDTSLPITRSRDVRPPAGNTPRPEPRATGTTTSRARSTAPTLSSQARLRSSHSRWSLSGPSKRSNPPSSLAAKPSALRPPARGSPGRRPRGRRARCPPA